MSNQKKTVTPTYSVPFMGYASYDNAPTYSLEYMYSELQQRRELKAEYHQNEESLVISLGLAKEGAEGLQAIATLLFDYSGKEKVCPALLQKLAVSLAHLADQTTTHIEEVQEHIRLDWREAIIKDMKEEDEDIAAWRG